MLQESGLGQAQAEAKNQGFSRSLTGVSHRCFLPWAALQQPGVRSMSWDIKAGALRWGTDVLTARLSS